MSSGMPVANLARLHPDCSMIHRAPSYQEHDLTHLDRSPHTTGNHRVDQPDLEKAAVRHRILQMAAVCSSLDALPALAGFCLVRQPHRPRSGVLHILDALAGEIPWARHESLRRVLQSALEVHGRGPRDDRVPSCPSVLVRSASSTEAPTTSPESAMARKGSWDEPRVSEGSCRALMRRIASSALLALVRNECTCSSPSDEVTEKGMEMTILCP